MYWNYRCALPHLVLRDAGDWIQIFVYSYVFSPVPAGFWCITPLRSQQPKKPSTVIQTCNSKAGRSEVLSHTQPHSGLRPAYMRHLLKKKKRKEKRPSHIHLIWFLNPQYQKTWTLFLRDSHTFSTTYKILALLFLSFSLFSFLLSCLAHLTCCVYNLAACGQTRQHTILFNSKRFGSNTIEWVQTVFSAWLNVSMYIIP